VGGVIYAESIFKKGRFTAEPGISGVCPMCKKDLIPKCGEINVWHWAHKSNKDCDTFSEGETKWHLDWKSKFNKNNTEVIIEKNNKKHIADVHFNGKTLELQNSPISTQEIYEREAFYNNMMWLFNGMDIFNNFNFRFKGNYYTFRWKYPRKSIWHCYKRVLIDFSNINMPCDIDEIYYDDDYLDLLNEFKGKIFEVKKIYHNVPCGGWGVLHNKDKLIKYFGGKGNGSIAQKAP
jgi:hypothetical protein